MLRTACLLIALLACGKSDKPAASTQTADPPAAEPAKPAEAPPPAVVSNPRCEALKEKFAAWTDDRVKSALGGVAADLKKEMEQQAAKEAAIVKDKFVGACVEMGAALDETCFEKRTLDTPRAKVDQCRKMVSSLERIMFRK